MLNSISLYKVQTADQVLIEFSLCLCCLKHVLNFATSDPSAAMVKVVKIAFLDAPPSYVNTVETHLRWLTISAFSFLMLRAVLRRSGPLLHKWTAYACLDTAKKPQRFSSACRIPAKMTVLYVSTQFFLCMWCVTDLYQGTATFRLFMSLALIFGLSVCLYMCGHWLLNVLYNQDLMKF